MLSLDFWWWLLVAILCLMAYWKLIVLIARFVSFGEGDDE